MLALEMSTLMGNGSMMSLPTSGMSTVFQSYALFPHMTVFENVAFPLRLKKVDKAEIERRVSEVLKMVQLAGFEKRSIQNYLVVNANG